ncbi:hypothetical protein ACHWQZ_G006111 [Mnemiopsis leidyi]
MGKHYLLLLLLAVQCAICQKALEDSREAEPRIFYGDSATPGEYPFMVHVDLSCGGALITRRAVLTAAHCLVLNGKLLEKFPLVVAGDNDLENAEGTETVLEVEQMIVHPDYNEVTLQNDIGILLLKEEVTFTGFISEIKIPEGRSLYEEGTPITIIGWGETEKGFPNILQKHVYEMSNQDDCKKFWQTESYDLYEGMMCTGKPPLKGHAWGGDSGGPVVARAGEEFVLVGLTSWGVDVPTENAYDVNVDVLYYSDWIMKNVGESNEEGEGGGESGGEGGGEETDGELRVKLVVEEGEMGSMGVVVMSENFVTGTVCNSGVGIDEVSAICRHLGYDFGVLKHLETKRKKKQENMDLPEFAWTNLKCNPDVADLSQCTFEEYPNKVPCFSGEELAVQCSDLKWNFQVVGMENKVSTSGESGTVKGKVGCRVEAKKYGQSVDLKSQVEVVMLNFVAESEVPAQFVTGLKYKKKLGGFSGKIRASQGVVHDCFVCAAALRGNHNFLAVKAEESCEVEEGSLNEAVRNFFQNRDTDGN